MDYFQCQRGGRNWRFWFKWPHLCVGVCVLPETTAARAHHVAGRDGASAIDSFPPNKNLMLTNATFLFRQKRPSVQLLFSSLIGPSAINVPIDEYLSHSKEFCGKCVCTATLRCHIQPNSSSFHSLSGLKVKSLTGQFKKFEYSNENNYRLCRQNGLNSRPWACFVPKQRSLPLAKNRFVFHQMEMAAMMKRRH